MLFDFDHAKYHIYFRLMVTIFDSPLMHTSGNLRSSLVVLPDPENMGIAVGISLLSIVYTSWYTRYVISTSGYWPPSLIYESTHTDIEQYFHLFLLVVWPPNTWYGRWTFVAVMYISWDTHRYIISATILDFWLPVSSGSVTDSTIWKYDPKNIEVAD